MILSRLTMRGPAAILMAAATLTGSANAAPAPTPTQSAPAPAASAPPAPTQAASAPATSPKDRKFVVEAIQRGGLTVQASQLALQRTASDAVKQFAQKAMTDQNATNAQLAKVAELNGIDPAAPESNAMADSAVKQLDKLTGPAFDKRYAEIESKNETALTKLFHDQEHSTDDKTLASLAGNNLPIYEEDSDKAAQLASEVAKQKIAGKAAPAGH